MMQTALYKIQPPKKRTLNIEKHMTGWEKKKVRRREMP